MFIYVACVVVRSCSLHPLALSLLQNIHVSFLRTVPPYSHQADVWVELLKYFNYMKVIFIHSSDTDGRALLGRFQTTSQSLEDDVEIKVHVGCALYLARLSSNV